MEALGNKKIEMKKQKSPEEWPRSLIHLLLSPWEEEKARKALLALSSTRWSQQERTWGHPMCCQNCKALQLLSTSNPKVHLAVDTQWDVSVKALSTSSSVRVDLLGPGDGFFAKKTRRMSYEVSPPEEKENAKNEWPPTDESHSHSTVADPSHGFGIVISPETVCPQIHERVHVSPHKIPTYLPVTQ